MTGHSKLSADDKVALASLIARYVESWTMRSHYQNQASKISEQITELNTVVDKVSNAFDLYGFDTTDKAVWDKVKAVIGPESYNKAIDAGNALAKANGAEIEEEEIEEVDAADAVPDAGASGGGVRPTVRNALLARLESIAPKGEKASNLRAFLESTYGLKLHEKTTGMSLYRLSQEDPPKVRREGRTWFFVRRAGETKNPGAATPGSIESLL